MTELFSNLLVDPSDGIRGAFQDGPKSLRAHIRSTLKQQGTESGSTRGVSGLRRSKFGRVETRHVAERLNRIQEEQQLRMHTVSCSHMALRYLQMLPRQRRHILGSPERKILRQKLGPRYEGRQVRERYEPLRDGDAGRESGVQQQAQEGLGPRRPQAHQIKPQERHTSSPVRQQHRALEDPEERRHELVLRVRNGARQVALEKFE
mmetsp:Transcript_126303/g.404308  ORF Transcript_126303/g.404308 Transcript_126303/m.404308 type:complete len:206 (+) Transcript_126303:691-1308(+)